MDAVIRIAEWMGGLGQVMETMMDIMTARKWVDSIITSLLTQRKAVIDEEVNLFGLE